MPHPCPPLTIGLTGGIGSGKSTVTAHFATLGVPVIDTDEIAHSLTAAGGLAMPAIEATFGAKMLTPQGSLNRPAMRARVFGDAAARAQLEALLHPLIRAEVQAQRARLAQAGPPYVVVAVPLLVENPDWRAACDRILVVDCPIEVQRSRVMQRSGLSASEVDAIVQAQADRATRRAAADDLIDNAGPPSDLVPQIQALHERYQGLSKSRECFKMRG
jgi:dephospho-CoA kinase